MILSVIVPTVPGREDALSVAQHDPEPPAPYLVVLPNNVWLIGKTEPTVIGLDPLPVPARDFGIVIDCVKLAQ